MKQNTCSKGDGGLSIHLLTTNVKFSFLETNSFKTGLSDHIIHTKKKFKKFEPKPKNRYTAISNEMIVTN